MILIFFPLCCSPVSHDRLMPHWNTGLLWAQKVENTHSIDGPCRGVLENRRGEPFLVNSLLQGGWTTHTTFEDSNIWIVLNSSHWVTLRMPSWIGLWCGFSDHRRISPVCALFYMWTGPRAVVPNVVVLQCNTTTPNKL